MKEFFRYFLLFISFCHQNDFFFFSSKKEETTDFGYIIVIGLLSSGLFGVCVVAGVVTYYKNDQIKKRYDAMRKWTLVVPEANIK
jgi:hypothetical protein